MERYYVYEGGLHELYTDPIPNKELVMKKKLSFDLEIVEGKIVISADLDKNEDGEPSVEGEIKIDLKELFDELT